MSKPAKLAPYRGAYRWEVPIALAVLALFSWWIVGPLVVTGSWYTSHDGMRYPYLIYRFKEAVDHGIFYPRWMTELMGGYGYPTFVYYQPAYFYAGLIFARFTDVVTASYWLIGSMFLVGGFGAYLIARRLSGPWLALFFAVLFLYSPYHARNFFVRGDFSELFAMMMMPCAFYFALRLNDAVSQGARWWPYLMGMVFFIVLIVTGHPFAAMIYLPVHIALIVFLSIFRPRGTNYFWIAMCGMGMGAVLSAPYWYTAFTHMQYVNYRGALFGRYNVLFRLMTWGRIFWPERNELEIFYLVLTYGGACFAILTRAGRAAMAALLALMVFMTQFSLPLWEFGYSVLKFMQFPWRINSVTTLLQFLVIIHLARGLYWLGEKNRFLVPAACVCIAYFWFGSVENKFYMRQPLARVAAEFSPELRRMIATNRMPRLRKVNYYPRINANEKNRFLTLTATREFHSKWMQHKGLPHRISQEVPVAQVRQVGPKDDKSWLKIESNSTLYRYYIEAHINERANVVINQFYFPGWKVVVDGKELEDFAHPDNPFLDSDKPRDVIYGKDQKGLIQLYFTKPGVRKIEAWYDGPTDWQLRNYLIFVSLVVLAMAAYWHEFFARQLLRLRIWRRV